jgi:hypothetical protein
MSEWIFTHPDTWTPVVIDKAPEWIDGENDTTYMARLGYRFYSQARHRDFTNFVGIWSLFVADAPDARYLQVLLVDGATEDCNLVWLPTFPDLLAYMRLYGELGQPERDQDEWDAMRDTLKKFFRAWHGHEPQACCSRCDPMGYERQQQRKAELRAKKSAHPGKVSA